MFDGYLHSGRTARAKPTPAALLKSINRGPVRCRTARTFICNGSYQNTDEVSCRHSRRRGNCRGRTPAYPSCSCRLHAAGDRHIGACCPGCGIDGGSSDSAQTPRLKGRDRSALPIRAQPGPRRVVGWHLLPRRAQVLSACAGQRLPRFLQPAFCRPCRILLPELPSLDRGAI